MLQIKVTLRTIILSPILKRLTNINEWCISEGADPDYLIELNLTENVLEGLQEAMLNDCY